MPALISMETNRFDKLAAWLIGSRGADQEGFYKRFMVPLYRLTAMEVCMSPDQRRSRGIYEGVFSSILAIIDPDDGHPKEEMVPDFAWFRPLSHNNPTWVLYWPDLEV